MSAGWMMKVEPESKFKKEKDKKIFSPLKIELRLEWQLV